MKLLDKIVEKSVDKSLASAKVLLDVAKMAVKTADDVKMIATTMVDIIKTLQMHSKAIQELFEIQTMIASHLKESREQPALTMTKEKLTKLN